MRVVPHAKGEDQFAVGVRDVHVQSNRKEELRRVIPTVKMTSLNAPYAAAHLKYDIQRHLIGDVFFNSITIYDMPLRYSNRSNCV